MKIREEEVTEYCRSFALADYRKYGVTSDDRQGSSVGESVGFITRRSTVQICLLAPLTPLFAFFILFDASLSVFAVLPSAITEGNLFGLNRKKVSTIKVESVKALHRYIHMIMVAHSLLLIKQWQVESIGLLKLFIEFYLKKTRKIPKFTLSSLKTFLEKCTFFDFDFKSDFRLLDKLCYGF